MNNEYYILVQGWDGVTGQWFDIDEAKDIADAHDIITARAADPENASTEHYSIVKHTRIVVSTIPA